MEWLRREWRSPAGLVADAVRLAALVSAVAVLPWQPAEAVLRFLLIFGLLVVTRVLETPRPFDAALGLLLLCSAWASALGWYFEHPWIDIPIHFALTGAAAAMLYDAVLRLDVVRLPDELPRRRQVATVVLTAVLGAAAAAVWELYEWAAENYLPSRILVGYDDAIGDMTMGILGSTVAGVLVARWRASGHGLRQDRGR